MPVLASDRDATGVSRGPKPVQGSSKAPGHGALSLLTRTTLDRQSTLLRKEGEARTSPFPGHTYPTGSVIGMPSAA